MKFIILGMFVLPFAWLLVEYLLMERRRLRYYERMVRAFDAGTLQGEGEFKANQGPIDARFDTEEWSPYAPNRDSAEAKNVRAMTRAGRLVGWDAAEVAYCDRQDDLEIQALGEQMVSECEAWLSDQETA